MKKYDGLSNITERAQALLRMKAERVADAKDELQEASANAEEAARAMQAALDSGDVDAYVRAKEVFARAQAVKEIKAAKASKAGAMNEDDRTAAKEILSEMMRLSREMDRAKRMELVEQLQQIRTDAMTGQQTICDLNDLAASIYREFIGKGNPPAYQVVKLGASVPQIERTINALSDQMIIFERR